MPAPNTNLAPANSASAPKGPDAGKTVPAAVTDNSKPAAGNLSAGNATAGKGTDPNPITANSAAPGNPTAANPTTGKQDQGGSAASPPGPAPTPSKPAPDDASKGALVAMNEPAKEAAKPARPETAKSVDEPDPFAESTDAKPAAKPPVGTGRFDACESGTAGQAR